ncbi:MAG: YaeQ family protein [Thalassotalea sp.]
MALKSTINKVTIHLSDMDRHYYDTINLTLAQHPSETDLRLMTRVIAFVLNAQPDLSFGKGVSDEDEAVIWQIDYSEQIGLWVELGQPDEKRIKKACNKAKNVSLYCYARSNDVWFNQHKSKLAQYNNLSVFKFDPQVLQELATWVSRTMEFQCSIQDGQLWLSDNERSLLIETEQLQ